LKSDGIQFVSLLVHEMLVVYNKESAGRLTICGLFAGAAMQLRI
jgi:hypothetical protein